MKLETGICGEQSVRVSAENTAKTMGSGTLDVFATPALVALAEKTCWQSVAPALEAGSGTVGTKLELEHTAPTPVGMTVTCESELTAVEGRKLVFKVSLHDEKAPWAAACPSSWVPAPVLSACSTALSAAWEAVCWPMVPSWALPSSAASLKVC